MVQVSAPKMGISGAAAATVQLLDLIKITIGLILVHKGIWINNLI